MLAISRRYHLSESDREDFSSAAHIHVVHDDYRVLRAFEGRCPLEVYLAAVVRSVFQEWRNTRWGRWRPSAAARRLGPVAILLETATVRDGLSMPEAVELLRTNHGVSESSDALHALAAQLPARTRRTFVGVETLDERPGDAAATEAHVDGADAARVVHALDRAIAALPPDDQLLLRLRFDQDVPLAAIVRMRGTDYQTTYRRLGRVLMELRNVMVSNGIRAEDVAYVLDRRGLAMREHT